MRLDRIGRQSDQLNAALCELGLILGKGCQLGSADGGVVFRVGKEDYPVVACPLMKVDGTDGCLGLKVGRLRPQAESVVEAWLVMMVSRAG